VGDILEKRYAELLIANEMGLVNIGAVAKDGPCGWAGTSRVVNPRIEFSVAFQVSLSVKADALSSGFVATGSAHHAS